MSKVRMFFAISVMIFGLLGLTKVISYDVALLMTSAGLGPVCLCNGIEELRSGKKYGAAADFLFSVAFLIIAIIRFLRVVQ